MDSIYPVFVVSQKRGGHTGHRNGTDGISKCLKFIARPLFRGTLWGVPYGRPDKFESPHDVLCFFHVTIPTKQWGTVGNRRDTFDRFSPFLQKSQPHPKLPVSTRFEITDQSDATYIGQSEPRRKFVPSERLLAKRQRTKTYTPLHMIQCALSSLDVAAVVSAVRSEL